MDTPFRLRHDRLEFARRITGLTSDADLALRMGKHRHTVGKVVRGGKVSDGFVGALLAAFPGTRFEDFFETPGVSDADDDTDGDDIVKGVKGAA